ncbi:hypothetical protein KC342_g15510 [Hortaea werneckii]|nr:hypothetical protein KC342_g15510 [Hortaea werneckii]KAI7383383.1 hypothetical protein KC328_g11294 [Hortaea werneckii]
MMRLAAFAALLLTAQALQNQGGPSRNAPAQSCNQKKPNIIFIFTDDQDRSLGSTNYQPILHRDIISQGLEVTNRFGGNYDKWVLAGEDKDYLPHWLNKAGYRTEYIGKLINGYNTQNYATRPREWSHVDALVDPYTYAFNTVVMSANGKTPISCPGYHQTDVIRAKALDRIENAFREPHHDPLYLPIAPASCQVSQEYSYNDSSAGPFNNGLGFFNPVPLARHADDFPDVLAPKPPNYNPPQEYTDQKPTWLGRLPRMNDCQIEYSDNQFRDRIRSLRAVDEIIEDVVKLLAEKGELDNTYIIYSSYNGYHLGAHRAPAGKALRYADDTNLPFFVRGPGVAAGTRSTTPSTHTDLAPTFLDISGLSAHGYPSYLDGQSLLGQWQHPESAEGGCNDAGIGRDIINIEFWGGSHFEAPPMGITYNTTFKTLRIVSDAQSWFYSKWCTNESELYDTKDKCTESRLFAPYGETTSEDSNYQVRRNEVNAGGWKQRNVTFEEIVKTARELTEAELTQKMEKTAKVTYSFA